MPLHRISILAALVLTALPAAGQPLIGSPSGIAAPAADDPPPGLHSARLLPGWVDKDGNRVLALELQLLPGWKTYWRHPGDTGLPPQFAWEGSQNLRDVTLHWPAPQAVRSGNALEMGYHDRLVLPFTARPVEEGQPVGIRMQMDLGLCKDLCVPARLELAAEDPGEALVPAITDALASEPRRLATRPACRAVPIEDGLRLSVALPQGEATLAAIEVKDRPEIWVSGARILGSPEGPRAEAELVGPSARPFALQGDDVRLTVVSDAGAVEMLGCDLRG